MPSCLEIHRFVVVGFRNWIGFSSIMRHTIYRKSKKCKKQNYNSVFESSLSSMEMQIPICIYKVGNNHNSEKMQFEWKL